MSTDFQNIIERFAQVSYIIVTPEDKHSLELHDLVNCNVLHDLDIFFLCVFTVSGEWIRPWYVLNDHLRDGWGALNMI